MYEIVHPFVVNYSLSSVSLLAVAGTVIFLFREIHTPTDAMDATSAKREITIVNEPSPKMEPVNILEESEKLKPILVEKVESPRSQSTK